MKRDWAERFPPSPPEIEAKCPACDGDIDVWADETEMQCDDCMADISITRNPDGGVSLSSDDEYEGEDDGWETPEKLYHGTSLKRFKEMLASPKSYELYLADSVGGTGMYAETASAEDESPPVTIVFDTDKLVSTGQLWPDWDDVDTMISNGDADADGSPLFGDADSARDVSWMDSLRIINTCSYEGDFSGAIIEVLLDDDKVAKPPFGKLAARTPPAKLYHGTFGWNSGAISEGGITPGKDANWNLSDRRYVYLTETPKLAANWVREAYEGGDVELDWDRATAAVFDVDTAALDAPVEPDPSGGPADWRHRGTIPATAAHLVYEADYTDDIPDPDEDGGHVASRWWRVAEMIDESGHEPTISFDFDDVLHYAPGGNPIDFWEWESWVPREPYVSELRRLASEGHRIIVVSHRNPGMDEPVLSFAAKHGLKIDAVHCVGVYGSKLRVLEEEGATIHYDDAPAVIDELRGSGIELVEVPRTDEDDLSWVPNEMWMLHDVYYNYADRMGIPAPSLNG